ncbi:MAG: SRPBCC domain-containing protein [Myxococcota bacterium]
MKKEMKLEVSTPSDREIRMVRGFAASRERVYRAFTDPKLVPRWMGADAWPMTACSIDLKVGGRFRYVWKPKEGAEIAVTGTYVELEATTRIVHTEIFDEDWTGGETRVETRFDEQEGTTIVTMTIVYSSMDARDGALKTGMAEGMEQGYGNLDRVFAEESAKAPQAPASGPS